MRSRRSGSGRPSGDAKASGRRVTSKAPSLAHVVGGSGRSEASPTTTLQDTHSVEGLFCEVQNGKASKDASGFVGWHYYSWSARERTAQPAAMTGPHADRFNPAAFLALLAIVGMAYYLVSVVAAHLLRPDVHLVSEPVSYYAVGPYGFFIGIAIFALGVGSLALTLGLHLSIAPPGRSRVGLLLLALYGVGQLVVAIFSIDAESAQTTAGIIHNIAGNISFFCFPPAVILLSLHMGEDERWRSLKRPALTLSLVVLVGAISVMVSANVVGGFGVAQRLFLLATVLWMLLAAIRLRSTSGGALPERR
jgi:hypothetical protein